MKILTPEEKLAIQTEADKINIEKLTGDNETISLINKSLQTEADSEHFLTYSWRPLAAYSYFLICLVNYAVCPLLKISSATIPSEVHYAF